MNFYPLLFEPILKERIWGGTKLKTVLNKKITSEITGESWEISTVENDVSKVSNGDFNGKSLNDLIHQYPNEILGTKVHESFGFDFPLLFKFLCAREDLSIQVHPNDELAKKRHNSFGKTEMWFVMQADENAELIVGFKENSSQKEYENHLKSNSVLELLETFKVKTGDVFFLETGTIHAIGAGTVIAEIQQTSDITYRIFDFNRKDANGNERELHTELALEAINYNKVNSKITYQTIENQSCEIVHCNYFKTNIINLSNKIDISKTNESFVVYMCTEGYFEIDFDNKNYVFKKGDTVLLPAILTKYSISGKANLLEIFL